ncbi:MAG TPA: hypothetical protein VFS47_07065 [Steroidobacteraceae bacterium]|nr:hypothetical protein [Steroidobacteraceae bacterium]
MEFLKIRSAVLALSVMSMCGCLGQSRPLIREYFDETTAATIREVTEPWLFVRERPEAAVNAGDYVSLAGFDVNRSGEHRTYLVVRAWSTIDRTVWREFAAPELQIIADGRVLTPKFIHADPKSIGLGTLQKERRGLRRWIYAVDAEPCGFLSNALRVQISLRQAGRVVMLTPANNGGDGLSQVCVEKG